MGYDMIFAFAFVAAAVCGTLIRASTTSRQDALSLPWRTLGLNCVGALVLGYLIESGHADQIALTVAGLGSLTTFSTVAAETTALLDDDQRARAIAYLVLTVAVGLTAAWLGLTIGEATS